jgi:hypothetical protein
MGDRPTLSFGAPKLDNWMRSGRNARPGTETGTFTRKQLYVGQEVRVMSRLFRNEARAIG